MFKSLSLQSRLIGSFLLMGLIVLVVALVGWSGATRLGDHINTLGNNTLPSVTGLWKINEGQTQIQSSERALLNTFLKTENRQFELNRIKNAKAQIDEGFKQYESVSQTADEKKLYQKFLGDWKRWQQDHERFLGIYQQFAKLGVLDPANRLAELVSQERQTSPEFARAKAADALLDELSELAANEELNSFNTATESVLAVVEYNQNFGEAAQKVAETDVAQTSFWVFVGMILGPLTAIIFGVFFSITIAKPLGAKISGIVNTIVTSSSEIAATVEQQERTAAQQAASVNQTTITMDELGASSQQSAEQAEAAATGSRQVLSLTEGGSQAVGRTLEEMALLKDRVGAIASQILRLSEQTNQIGNISGLVSDLANQTNMLALNAAVEAVRAGEHGKGFAVVAAEIRKLAEQSKKSAGKINVLVSDIQNAINVTVMVTDEGTKTVEAGVKTAQGTAQAFTGVADAIENIAINSQQISLSAKQQAIAIQQVVDAMSSLNVAAKENASGITQTKIGIQRLNEAALNLKSVV
ncbi:MULTISPECIES: methyl-accepting chemotaxis protein [unclassified Coleofasciculus]|uniref:HAMP domain-containing methyl-accepting chemotaxis protein n=1 Tax=Cyanophyceae TaxID=3028117 RepID=UPI001682487B|nr:MULTISPECIES: methyl-accepting chemotaxis protein [unclassified Coleofasciculus]MBD1878025.1 methyl-accepting chemotaxis protein [Coleofasciculus sp. FACHB-T130]MBD2537405.1 methyl-accepting chemotaxis protein [Coleofasciculus sp. FACHB-SPT36]